MDCPDAEMLAQLAAPSGDPAVRAEAADHASECADCHAAVVALLGPSPTRGFRIDRYIVTRRLGAGGMGVVYEAYDPELDRDVAIKMLHPGAAGERLRREARALARLSHPNVVAVYDVGEHAGQTFVAMALVDGMNLRGWLATEPDPDAIVDALCEAGRGIVAAHEAGLVHRDLKPDNIFVAKSGEVLVGDFGLARDPIGGVDDLDDVSTAATAATLSSIAGTPAYMAPEQRLGTVSAKSDQFSFCVTAYEALYGMRPGKLRQLARDATTLDAAAATIVIDAGAIERGLHPATAPIERASRSTRRRIERALQRGLATDPSDRFPRMADLLDALAPNRRRWPWWLLGVIVVGGTIAITWRLVRADVAAPPDIEASCAPSRLEIDRAWDSARRANVIAALDMHGANAATELVARIDDHARRWGEVRYAACAATVTHAVPAANVAARIDCLESSAAALDSTTTAIAADPVDLRAAWQHVDELLAPEACSAGAPRETWQALDGALDLAIRSLDEDVPAEADPPLRRALAIAETLHAPVVRARVLALAALAACRQSRRDDSARLLELADAIAVPDAHPARDVLLHARAECTFRRDDFVAAVPLLEQDLARVQRQYGRGSRDEYILHAYLAMAYTRTNRPADGDRALAAWRDLHDRYIDTNTAAAERADGEAKQALERGDLDAAIAAQRRAVAGYTAANMPLRAMALVDLGIMLEVAADWRAAIATYDLALAALTTRDPDDEDTRRLRAESIAARADSRYRLGHFEAALADYERAIVDAAAARLPDVLARSQLGVGKVATELGDPRRAVRTIRDALPQLALKKDGTAYALGDARYALARAAWALGYRAEARATIELAIADLMRALEESAANPLGHAQVPFRRARLDEATRWRAAHR